MAAVGIDLGSALARVAISREADPELLVVEGSTPDFAAIASVDGDEIMTGDRAARRAITHPRRTVRRPKVLLGRVPSDPALRQVQEAWRWSADEGGAGLVLDLDGRRHTVEELVAAILARLLRCAREHLGEAPRSVALGVPDWFAPAQREALERAATLAGIEAPTLVSESLAAALGLRLDDGPQRRVALVDIGASAATVAVVAAGGGSVEVLAASSSASGGEEIDRGLVRVALTQLKKASVGPEANELLRETCEAMKIELAATPIARRQLPPLGPDAPRPLLTFDRTKLAAAMQPLILGLKSRVLWACRDAKVPLEHIDELVLVGGGCKSSIIARGVERLLGKPARSSPLTAGAVARGAALYAQMRPRTIAAAAGPARPPVNRVVAPRPRPPAPPQAAAPPAAPTEAPPRPSAIPTVRPPAAPPPEAAPPSVPDVATAPPRKISWVPEAPSSPGRPSIPFSAAMVGAAPEVIGSGRIVNPADMAQLLAMPINAPLTSADLDPVALPVLLLRMIARASTNGTLTVTMDGESAIAIAVEYGTIRLKEPERAALIRTFSLRTGSYAFEFEEPPAYSEPLGDAEIFLAMLHLVYECLRSWMKEVRTEDLRAALGDRLTRCAIMTEKRRRIVSRLPLPAQEARLVKKGFDGTWTGEDLATKSGVNARSVLSLLHALALLRLIDWKEAEAKVERTLADEVRERAAALAFKDHFEALSVHWTAPLSEIEQAFEKVCKLTAPGGAWHVAAPEACETIRRRADQAHAILRPAESRMRYRLEIHGNVDFAAIADLLSQKAKAASMRSDKADYEESLAVLTELIAASKQKRRRSKIDF